MTTNVTSKAETEQEQEDRLEAAFKRLQAIMRGEEEDECQNTMNPHLETTQTPASARCVA